MRLERVGELELVYRDSSFGEKFLLARPYGGESGVGYGEGDGSIQGERIQGKLRWVNHPRRRGDGSMLPDAHGVIRTGDGAIVFFTLQGRTVWVNEMGRQLLSVEFESGDDRYKWLNNTYCILEGKIDPVALKMTAQVYSCVSDLL